AAGGVSSLALNAGDVRYGFTDQYGTFTPQASYTGYCNTIQVTMRRDGSANGALPLFFAKVLGVNTESLTATASGTIYTGGFSGAKVTTTGNSGSSNGKGNGAKKSNGSYTSSGTVGSGAVKGFDPGAGVADGLLLPVAFDVNYWNQFMVA